MHRIRPLRNAIQEYAWGSRTAIAELVGARRPSERPQAELWMGAHPRAPSQVRCDGGWIPLPEWIQRDPAAALGARVAEKFDGELPFLFKVLAAERPLSIQVHPDARQAREGFARENALGVALSAPERSYRDCNHKPELVCALTPFWALKGFRRIAESLALFEALGVEALAPALSTLRERPDRRGLACFFAALVQMERERRRSAVAQAVAAAAARRAEDPAFARIVELDRLHPGDVGVLCPALMNLVCLEPGEALSLRAGELHGYLGGVAVEIMANSDNVLRGALTAKHVNVPALLRITRFEAGECRVLRPVPRASGEEVYEFDVPEFELSRLALRDAAPFLSPSGRGIEILLCVDGEARAIDLAGGAATPLPRGGSLVVPAAVPQYRLEGRARIYRAAVP